MSVRYLLLLSSVLAACSANDDIHSPTIAGLIPARASPGATVTVEGSYFCGQPDPDDGEEIDPLACAQTGTVSFDATPGSVLAYTDTRIIVEVPALAAGAVTVTVAVAGRNSNGVTLIVEP